MCTSRCVVLALLLAGCSATELAVPATRDPCAPLAITAAGDAASSVLQTAAVADAIAMWRGRGVRGFDLPGEPARITLQVTEASPLSHGYYDPETGTVFINSDVTDPRVLSIVIAHELGHAFGLAHVDDGVRTSLMNRGNLVTPPTAEDQHEVELVWGACN